MDYIRLVLISLLFALPIILIPIFMRFIVSSIILWRTRKRFFPMENSYFEEGWQKSDTALIKKLEQYIKSRVKTYIILDINPATDLEEILLQIETHYRDKTKKQKKNNASETEEKLSYSFSLLRILECLYIAQEDFISRSSDKLWFKIIKKSKLIWFYRTRYFQIFTAIINRFKPLKILWQTRILGKALAITIFLTFFPILGLPAIIFYSIRSIITSVFLEGFFRFFYAAILYQISYYGLFLYGRDNPHIEERLAKISQDTIKDISKQTEEKIKKLLTEGKHSQYYEKAIEIYKTSLTTMDIPQDELFAKRRAQKLDFMDRIKNTAFDFLNSAGKAYKELLIPPTQSINDLEKIKLLYKNISSIYAAGLEEPIYNMRIGNILEALEISTIYLLNTLRNIPGGRLAASKITLEFIITLKNTSEHPVVKNTTEIITGNYKGLALGRKLGVIQKGIRGIQKASRIAVEAILPVALRFLQDIIRKELYHKAGRTLIYSWEKSAQKQAPDFLLRQKD
ncbi:hypothetical protein WKV44_04920 [Spirochaetia bacterium 38H-sp]|uniref:DUF697 domain-containing protein n=1 Tax=Rarispira pelagica TaxID=3141764 RepID=A0ABU9UBL3_9SPIR